ncbi:COG5433: Transposase [Richelia intracellularis]|nr:COG5433: Transposase [Richelia intracellularis]
MVSNANSSRTYATPHPRLYGQVKNWFEQQLSQGFKGIIHSYDKRVEKGHHRTEKRQIWCVPISQQQTLHNQDNWVGLKWVVMVVRVIFGIKQPVKFSFI